MKTNPPVGSRWIRLTGILAGLLMALVVIPAVRAEEGDAPTRVARISYLRGQVSFQPGGTGDWGSAAINRPMTIGDRIWTEGDARAELQAGAATIHLAGNTALSFLNLDENVTQMRVAEGSINFRLVEVRTGETYEVDTPNVAFTVMRAGDFRVNVNENGDVTAITAFRGEGEVTANGENYRIREGERAEFRGTEQIQHETGPAPRMDDFDRWSNERDLRGERSKSARYVSRDVVGYEDLDDYGEWQDIPEYGHVWYPRYVDVGWAPYSYGYWSWVGPWGWTWVDYAPWGFAPFHYGRWAFIGSRWGWCPGPIFARPFYAPALVAWVGGHNWGIGLGFGGGFWGGHVGWCPLGFGEPFFPWWHASNVFITNINIRNTVIRNRAIINTTNIRNVNFMFAHNARAVTATTVHGFANAQGVNRGAVRVSQEALRNAQVNVRTSVSPTQRSVLGANAGARVTTPPRAIESRAVVTRNVPAAAARNLPVRAIAARNPMQTPAAVRNERASINNPVSNPNRPALRNDRGPAGNPAIHGERLGIGMRTTPSAAVSGTISPRQHELRLDKPPAAVQSRSIGANPMNGRGPAGNTRSWEAQGNVTDRGRAPQESLRPHAGPVGGPVDGPIGATMRRESPTQANRPPWAQGSGTLRPQVSSPRSEETLRGRNAPAQDRSWRGPGGNGARSYPTPAPHGDSSPRSYSPRSYSPPPRADAPRSYSPPRSYSSSPQRSYSPPPQYAPPRSYSPPARNYAAPSHGYSAPSRSYSAPSRSYSAPRSSGGGSGGGNPRGGGVRGRH